MKKIDVKKNLEEAGVQLNVAAITLFPDNKHATMALDRVMAGVGLLNSDQVYILSELVGKPIDELYS